MATKKQEVSEDVASALVEIVRASEKKTRAERVDVVEVHRHTGMKIDLPVNMTIPQAIEVLKREHTMQEEVVAIIENLDCFPWDGAYALQHVLEEMFGVVFAQAIPSFFGSRPPQEISLEIGYKKVAKVRWGRFRLPGVPQGAEGVNWLETSMGSDKAGRPQFVISANVQRKYEAIIRTIAQRTRERVVSHSIYRGKAFRMGYATDGSGMPEVKFLDLSKTRPEEMVFSADLQMLIEVNLWTPIRYADTVAKLKTPLKRGILLAGPYGTGKTLLAYVTASIAVEEGWTFIYLNDVADLPTAILWAKQFGRVVIFAEDLDKLSEEIANDNTIPNTLDGLDTKDSEIMVVLTTNHIEQVNQLLVRPGRLDCILPIEPPDAEAQVKLIGVYGRGLLAKGEDFSEVGALLASQNVIPAVTREVVERAKLAYITRAPDKAVQGVVSLTASDLLWSVKTMQVQAKLLAPKPEIEPTAFEVLGGKLGSEVVRGMRHNTREVAQRVANEVAQAVRDSF